MNGLSEKNLLRVLKGETVDNTPFWFMRQAGRYLPEYRELRARAGSFLDLCYTPALASEITLQPIRRFGMDAAILFADILLIPDALGQHLEFIEGRGPVLRPVRSGSDIAKLSRAHLHAHLAPVYETVERVRGTLSDETVLIGFAGSPWTVASYMIEGGGSPDHAVARAFARDHREDFEALIDILVTATVDYLAAQIEAGAEVVQLFDSWAGRLDEDGFNLWSIGPTRRITRALKERFPDVPIIGFPRDGVRRSQGYFAHAGVDALGLGHEIALTEATQSLTPLGPVQGNLAPRLLVEGGDRLIDAARDILTTFEGCPHVFNLGHGIVPETPPEHVAMLCDFLRGWRNG